jgi:hydrogenase nickel incorporation protein HypB
VNTGTGCHLEADMVARGLGELRPAARSIVMIENVGNLVCPAMFDLGERAKVVVASVTEGEDKPIKYPYLFRAAQVMLLNKTRQQVHDSIANFAMAEFRRRHVDDDTAHEFLRMPGIRHLREFGRG